MLAAIGLGAVSRHIKDVGAIEAVCGLAGSFGLFVDLRKTMLDLSTAVSAHASEPILDWLLEAVSFQGISDEMARRYIDDHPAFSSLGVLRSLASATCPKLSSYWSFEHCGFEKTWGKCNAPHEVHSCSLPDLDLRNGRLNQTAYALVLFCRDVAGGDLVGWIDASLAEAASANPPDQRARWAAFRQSLLEPLGHLFGVSDKALSMALSDLLLGTGADRPLWIEAAVGMIAVDTLVHNWLHRTGIINRWGRPHPYGPNCYRPGGCADAIELLSLEVDARQFDLEFPQCFPRFVQKAIWSFCARSEFDRCNGVRIDDRVGCQDHSCPLAPSCDRRPLS